MRYTTQDIKMSDVRHGTYEIRHKTSDIEHQTSVIRYQTLKIGRKISDNTNMTSSPQASCSSYLQTIN